MGGRRSRGRCGRRERERGKVGGRAVGGSLQIEGGSMRKKKWEGEGTSRIDQEDIEAMNTNRGIFCNNNIKGECGVPGLLKSTP